MSFNSNNRTLRTRGRINDSPTKIYRLDAITTIAKLPTFIQTEDFVLDVRDTFAVNAVALINK